MNRQDFEKIAGRNISAPAYYNIIEPMYYATVVPIEVFVKLLNYEEIEKAEYMHRMKDRRE